MPIGSAPGWLLLIPIKMLYRADRSDEKAPHEAGPVVPFGKWAPREVGAHQDATAACGLVDSRAHALFYSPIVQPRHSINEISAAAEIKRSASRESESRPGALRRGLFDRQAVPCRFCTAFARSALIPYAGTRPGRKGGVQVGNEKAPTKSRGCSILTKASMRYASATDACISHNFRK
jgi:hypothetical protein